jgi:hypothetical protein
MWKKQSARKLLERGPNVWVVHHEGKFSIEQEGHSQFLQKALAAARDSLAA